MSIRREGSNTLVMKQKDEKETFQRYNATTTSKAQKVLGLRNGQQERHRNEEIQTSQLSRRSYWFSIVVKHTEHQMGHLNQFAHTARWDQVRSVLGGKPTVHLSNLKLFPVKSMSPHPAATCVLSVPVHVTALVPSYKWTPTVSVLL